MKALMLSLALVSASASACPALLPQDVCQLQKQIYLHTDFKQTDQVRAAMVGLKDLLIRHDADPAVVREHILGLVDHVIEKAHQERAPWAILHTATGSETLAPMDQALRAYEKANGDVVPLDWQLPKGVRLLTFMVARAYEPLGDRTEYNFGLFGLVDQVDTVDQLVITRYPNEVIADKRKLGGYNETVLLQSGVPLFSIGGRQPTPLREGLYLVDIQMKGQAVTHGWFILSRTTPAGLPAVKSPVLSQVFHTDRPTFEWSEFYSPQYRPLEHRKRRLSITQADTGQRLWYSHAIYPRPLTSIPSPLSLANGNYDFNLAFEERWLAGGGVFIGRESEVSVPFSVQK